MLGILTFCLSSLAVIWTRKNDLREQLTDNKSRLQLATTLRNPADKLTANLRAFEVLITRIIGRGAEVPAFCLITSLAFSAIAFLVATAASSTSLESLLSSPDVRPVEYPRLYLVIVILGALACFGLARFRSKAEDVQAPELGAFVPAPSPAIWWHLGGVISFILAVAYTYHNVWLTVVVSIVAGGTALLSRPGASNSRLLSSSRPSVLFGAALGVLGFTMATFAFASEFLPQNIWVAATAISAVAAALAYGGLLNTRLGNSSELLLQDRGMSALLSLIGRPTMFGGFYCARSAGQFCAAVALLIVICNQLKLVAEEPVVIASSIIMVLCIFASGAASIAGAGALAFGAMIFITLYLLIGIGDLSIVFKHWSYVIVFWIIVPFVNMIFDSIRWYGVKRSLRLRVGSETITSSAYLFVDLVMVCASLSALSYFGTNAIRWYNAWAAGKGFQIPIPIERYLASVSADFSKNGLWLAIMLFSVLIPTVINVGIFLSSGLMRAIPDKLRAFYASRCEEEDLSRLETDRLAWRISTIDSLTGIIFFAAASIALVNAIVWVAPDVGRLLFWIATKL